ncbi:hypothetical protein CXB51_003887 [Gossypium anomalum]|uniref:ABC transporter domain-containing protein n=1 Tax=Gossypium anomalum TaxID=47600 RepID=A0A8J6DAK4_9ROSI|nr:hypothetical protein CXB51_003887 [Gossypium anomalum]
MQAVMPTVDADVAFGLGRLNLTNSEVRSRVSKALDAVGMSEYLQRPVQTLICGQKQRVAIAGALAEACKVLLLDELTTCLNERDQVSNSRHKNGGDKAVQNLLDISAEVTALWVTHRLEELEYTDDGRVIMYGDAASISKFIKLCNLRISTKANTLITESKPIAAKAPNIILFNTIELLQPELLYQPPDGE